MNLNVAPRSIEPASISLGAGTSTSFDRASHAQGARLTRGISSASVVGACKGRAVHPAMSPGKQAALLSRAQRKATRLPRTAAHCTKPGARPCIDPPPQDRQFAAHEWHRWPFNPIYQAFVIDQRGWHEATAGIEGVSRHHEQLMLADGGDP